MHKFVHGFVNEAVFYKPQCRSPCRHYVTLFGSNVCKQNKKRPMLLNENFETSFRNCELIVHEFWAYCALNSFAFSLVSCFCLPPPPQLNSVYTYSVLLFGVYNKFGVVNYILVWINEANLFKSKEEEC